MFLGASGHWPRPRSSGPFHLLLAGEAEIAAEISRDPLALLKQDHMVTRTPAKCHSADRTEHISHPLSRGLAGDPRRGPRPAWHSRQKLPRNPAHESLGCRSVVR